MIYLQKKISLMNRIALKNVYMKKLPLFRNGKVDFREVINIVRTQY